MSVSGVGWVTPNPPSPGRISRVTWNVDQGAAFGVMSDFDRLRAAADSRRRSDKVPFPDPAAAPLGTDSEAGVQLTLQAPLPRAVPAQDQIDPATAPAVSDESGRRIDGELTPQGQRRVAALTWGAVGLIIVIGAGVLLVVLAGR